MSDVVYLGPSLSTDEALARLPGALVLPPVEHGDLLRLDVGPGDRVLIVDGLFLQSAPVRHKEILHLIERGVTVAGSSSMGALRAAELWQFGMRGVGQVYQMYRDGTITGDDEVAIVHGPAEEGYRALSEPLVNIRVALRSAHAAGVIDAERMATLTEAARALPFRARGYRALSRVDGAADFLEWLRAHPSNAKAEDARLLLSLARADALQPFGPGDLAPTHVHTRLMDGWRARHGGVPVGDRFVSDTAAITAIMLFHPDFPAEHRQAVLAAKVGPAQTEARALELAHANGLRADRLPEPSWLAPHESDLDADERILRLMVRMFGAVQPRHLGHPMLPETLADQATLTRARAFARKAARLTDQLPRPDPHRPVRRHRFRAAAVDQHFATAWNCPVEQVEAHYWDRGFADADSFYAAAEPMTAYLRLLGPPRFDR